MTTHPKKDQLAASVAAHNSRKQAAIDSALTPLAEALGKVVVFTNQKGGVGKTSSAFNFAHFLNELGYRVAVVDLDGQGNATELFFTQDVLNRYVHTSALQLFEEGGAEGFQPLSHPSGIDVIATKRNSHELNNIDTLDISIAQTFFNNMMAISGNYDFIVIDTPPAPGVRTTSACAAAEVIFAPVLVDNFAEAALEGVLASIASIGALLGEDLKLDGILINGLPDNTLETRMLHKELAKKIGSPLITTPVRQSKPFSRAQRHGVPVWHLRSSGAERTVSKETIAAYSEMASRIEGVPAERLEFFVDISRAVVAKFAALNAGR